MKSIKRFLKQLFCSHRFIETNGVGVYQKGNREKIYFPVTRKICIKCHTEKTILESERRGGRYAVDR